MTAAAATSVAASAARWTKADVKRLCGAIDTYFVVVRPLGALGDFPTRFREVLAAHRQDIVVSALAGFERMLHARVTENRAAAVHAVFNPHVWGSSAGSMAARFETLAREAERDIERSEKLVARVRAEGLPPEVIAYDPMARYGRARSVRQ